MTKLSDIGAFLTSYPVFWLAITLLAYVLAQRIHQFSKQNSLCNPVALSIIFLIVLLTLTKTPYQTYFDGAQFIHFLLGPTTVELAIPLFDLRKQLAKNWLPILLGLTSGSIVALASAMIIAGLFGGSYETLVSLAPKSVTTPIAMSITEKLGGIPELSASLVVITGVLGAVLSGFVYSVLHITDNASKGFALGLASHGIGTSRAFQYNDEAGAYASLAIGLTGLTTAFLAPLLTPFIASWF